MLVCQPAIQAMSKEQLVLFIESTLPIPRPKVEEIVSHFQSIRISKNDYFIQKGKPSNRYLFLASGLIRAYTFDVEGNEVTTEFYMENQMVIEVASFFQQTESKENFQALEDCTGWQITFEQVQVLFHSLPEFREFGRMMLVKGFISFKEKSLSLINEKAEKRYEKLMATKASLFQRVPLKYIASYLGITDSSLSRIRRDISQK